MNEPRGDKKVAYHNKFTRDILFRTVVGGDETSDIVNVGRESTSRLVRGVIGNTKLELGCVRMGQCSTG